MIACVCLPPFSLPQSLPSESIRNFTLLQCGRTSKASALSSFQGASEIVCLRLPWYSSGRPKVARRNGEHVILRLCNCESSRCRVNSHPSKDLSALRGGLVYQTSSAPLRTSHAAHHHHINNNGGPHPPTQQRHDRRVPVAAAGVAAGTAAEDLSGGYRVSQTLHHPVRIPAAPVHGLTDAQT